MMLCAAHWMGALWLIATVGLVSVAEESPTPAERMLIDFDDKDVANQWITVNDNVMGGRSEGGPSFADGKLIFQGKTVTQGGGFSSIRTKPTDYQLRNAKGIVLRVRGDGRTYKADIRTDKRRGGFSVAYRADFETNVDGKWQEVRIPFRKFQPTLFGQTLDGIGSVDPNKVQTLGLMIYDKKAGPFKLEVDWIKAYGEPKGDQATQQEPTKPAASPIDDAVRKAIVKDFFDVWLMKQLRERSQKLKEWLETNNQLNLGEDAYLIPLVRYVIEDYRERPKRVKEMYEHFVKLGRTPASLREFEGLTDRFILGPLLSEIRTGKFTNVESITKVLAGAGDPYPVYAQIGVELKRSEADRAGEVYAQLIRRAARDENLTKERFTKLIELCGRVQPGSPNRGKPVRGARQGRGRGGRGDQAKPVQEPPKQVPFASFKGPNLDGKVVSTDDFKGNVLMIDFWATWCVPCLKQAPELVELHKQYQEDGLAVLGVSLDKKGTRDRVREVVKEIGMNWPHIYTGGYWQAEPALLNNVRSIPFVILLDRKGRPRASGLRGEELKQKVKELLDEGSTAKRNSQGGAREEK